MQLPENAITLKCNEKAPVLEVSDKSWKYN